MTLKQLIEYAMAQVGDSWGNVEGATLTQAQLEADELEPTNCDGIANAVDAQTIPDQFTVWTADWIYFPITNWSIEVKVVPRNPCDTAAGFEVEP